MREYDRRFVYKRVFASMVDRGVGTTSDRGLLGYVLDNQE